MRAFLLSLALASAMAACSPPAAVEEPSPSRTWTIEQTSLYPTARGLARPEDGLAFADGRVIVMDQQHGLRLINADQTTRPFGRFAEAGYVHAPPAQIAGPNGLELEPDGVHALVADVFSGAIYRVNIEDEAVELVYTHPFGVNTAIADSTGAIWFTQSTENAAGPNSQTRLFDALNTYADDGALFRLAPPAADGSRAPPQRVLDGFQFANGIVIDEARGEFYLNETMGNRVNAYRVNVATGELSDHRVLAEITGPDNIERGAHGLLVVTPALSALIQVDPETGATQTLFRSQTPESEAAIAEWTRRAAAREPMLELFAPPLWEPLPAPITGVILTPEGEPAYLSGLGDALVKLEP